jgi:shikimate dehydrogenase
MQTESESDADADADADAGVAARWRAVSGRTRLFPVIGHPVAQVRAPAVLNALFAQAGVDAVAFGLDLSPDRVLQGCRSLLASPNVGGLLVTVPHKKSLRALAQRVGPDADVVGAVNALRRADDGAIEGELFDGAGFVAGVLAAGHVLQGRRVLLLGGGGAGSAIAVALAQAGIAALEIFDSVPVASHALVQSLQPRFWRTRFASQAQPDAAGADIVINASPLGLRSADALPIAPARLDPGTLVCDIIMEPAETRWLAAARARGLPVHAGRAMFDHQVASYLAFFGFAELARLVRVTPAAVIFQETA